MTATSSSGVDTKYCHICDIKFNYINTFNAHKQFYCKNANNELDGHGTTKSSVISTRASPNQTSVVTRTAEASVL